MENNLEGLFKLAIEFGYICADKNLNAKEKWGNVKAYKHLNNEKTRVCNWEINRQLGDVASSDIVTIYNYIHNDLGMYGEDGDKELYGISQEEWLPSHFVLQTIRIPKTSECSLIKILQIGLNIGQYNSHNEKGKYKSNVQEFFRINRLDDIKSYINLDECVLPQVIIDETTVFMTDQKTRLDAIKVGGRDLYYNKYLKYKNKYLVLKNIQ